MTKPGQIWLILSFCGLLILGAMGWLTAHILELERERAQAVEEAELQHRVRLALSSMDTAAASLLVIENQRPPYQFRAFYNPGDVFDASYRNLDQRQVLQPSPLANDLPEFVNLHFEILPDGSVRSPQVPSVDDGIWGRILTPSKKVQESARANFEDLQRILDAPPAASGPSAFLTNGSMMCAAAHPESATGTSAAAPEAEAEPTEGNWMAEQVLKSTAQERIQSPSYQKEFSKVEKGSRKRVFDEAVKKAAEESNVYGANRVRAAPQAARAPSPSTFAADAVEAESRSPGDDAAGMAFPENEVSPFRVLWVAGELFAVRQVTLAGEERYQGVWFDAAALKDYLLKTVNHLLPAASLQRVELVGASLANGGPSVSLKSLQDDPLALVTMPWRLQPGEVARMRGFQPSQIHLALAVGWVAVLLALLASAVLVRGVLKLSERRARFVSSVTHELRTPLTTFQLYSDLLAEGMVTEPAKQKSYLQTLRREAGRLNHLIENVLAYSRIERGATKTRKESLVLKDLIERLKPRLEERVRGECMTLHLEVDESCADRTLETDPAAVEQILFNLVDNACKYGGNGGDDGEIRVVASCPKNRLRVEVRDNGDGISRRDRRRLFRPFQKSSRDEADTKPGVGLGLSLCRRLARALGGDLRIAAARKPGACFVLDLPER